MEKKPSDNERKGAAPSKNRGSGSRPPQKGIKSSGKTSAKGRKTPSRPIPSPNKSRQGSPTGDNNKNRDNSTVRRTEDKNKKRVHPSDISNSRYQPKKRSNRPVSPEETTGGRLMGKSSSKKRPMKQQEADEQAERILTRETGREDGYGSSAPLEPPKKPDSPYIRRLKKVLLAALTVIVLIGICIALSFTVFFKIEDIAVEGKTRYNKDEIISASEIVIGENLLLCNTQPANDKIKDKFPYIENVSIEKQLFNKINIKVTEATPTSIIESDGKYIVLGKSGKIIEIDDKKLYDVPAVLGAKLKDVKLSSTIKYKDANLKKYLDKVIDEIASNGLKEDIITVDISNTSSIVLYKKNGFKILIGNFENIDYKLKTAAHILKTDVKATSLGTLDVSLASSEGGKSYLKITGDSEEIAKQKAEEEKKKQEELKKKQEEQARKQAEAQAALNEPAAVSDETGTGDDTDDDGYDSGDNAYEPEYSYDYGDDYTAEPDYGYDYGDDYYTPEPDYDSDDQFDGGYDDYDYGSDDTGYDTYDYGGDDLYDDTAGYSEDNDAEE